MSDRGKRLLAAMMALLIMSVLLTGCSKKLVDQSNKKTGEIVESLESSFAEEGWTYTGFEVLEKDKENDTMVVLMSYDVEGDAKEILENNTTEKAVSDDIYSRAEDINVKLEVELSAYNKDYDTIGCFARSTTWYVGDTEANEWIREQNLTT